MKQLSPFAFLKKYRVSTKKWGKDNFSKTLNHLRKEISRNECELKIIDKKAVRYSRVVKIALYHKINGEDYILVEDRQVFKKGTIRHRFIPNDYCLPAEKLFLHEDPKNGIKRLLEEELGIEKVNRLIRLKSAGRKIENGPSKTYPGLYTNRIMYKYEAWLPNSLYQNEYFEKQDDYTTYFKWEKYDPPKEDNQNDQD